MTLTRNTTLHVDDLLRTAPGKEEHDSAARAPFNLKLFHPHRASGRGQPERPQRALKRVAQHNTEGFGSCGNIGECEAVCPKEIKIGAIARMNRDYLRARWTQRRAT